MGSAAPAATVATPSTRGAALFVMSKTTTATWESRMYDGMSDRNRSCPAVSHSCKRTVPLSTGTDLETKSMPMVEA